MADYLLLETGDRLLLETGDGLLLESSGGSEIVGTLSVTLAALTSTATGTVLVSGTESATLGSVGLSATGTVEDAAQAGGNRRKRKRRKEKPQPIEGKLSTTLGNVTLDSHGLVYDQQATQLESAAMSAAGVVGVSGITAASLEDTQASGRQILSGEGPLVYVYDDFEITVSDCWEVEYNA